MSQFDKPTGRTKRKIRILMPLLALVLIIVCIVQAYRKHSIESETGKIINISGRQRMFSQRIALLAALLEDAEDQNKNALQAELKQLVDQFEEAHLALRDGSGLEELPEPLSSAAAAIFYERPHRLDQQVAEHLSLLRSYLTGKSTKTQQILLDEIASSAIDSPLLSALDALVSQLQSEAEQEVANAEWLLTLCLAFTGSILAANIILLIPDNEKHLLAADREQIQLVLDSLPSLVVFKNRNSVILRANRAATEKLGFKQEEMEGHRFSDLFPHNSKSICLEDEAVMEMGTPKLNIIEQLGEQWFRTDRVPVKNEQGVVTGLIVVRTDITDLEEAKRTAEESEQRFRGLANSAPTLIWVTERDKSCSWLNRRWLEYTGTELEQQLGFGWVESVHPEDRDDARNGYSGAFDKREPFSLHYRLRRADGEYRWFHACGQPRFDGAGQFLGYVGMSIDEHDSRQNRLALENANQSLQETQAIYRTLIDQSENFNGLMHLDGTLTDANRTALAAAGVSEEDVLGKKFWDTPWWAHSEELQDRLKEAIVKAAAGETDGFEATHLGPTGEVIHVAFLLKPVKNEHGETIHLIPEGRDITLHKRRENDLQNLLSQLDKSNKELEQFAYVASHDLQEPLRKISAYAQLLREECEQELSQDGKEYLTVVEKGAKRLKILVSDLLGFSRITTRGNPLAPTNANECLQEALENLELSIKETGSQVTMENFPEVIADRSQLTLLFQNLVSNAIKYRGEAIPEIHIGGRELGDKYEFFVRDNGIGIEPQFYQRIFEIFQRLHNRREYTGTGIGLAVCQRIAERFGGEIWVESSPQQGSTFYFTVHTSAQQGGSHADVRELETVSPTD